MTDGTGRLSQGMMDGAGRVSFQGCSGLPFQGTGFSFQDDARMLSQGMIDGARMLSQGMMDGRLSQGMMNKRLSQGMMNEMLSQGMMEGMMNERLSQGMMDGAGGVFLQAASGLPFQGMMGFQGSRRLPFQGPGNDGNGAGRFE